jgi:hypothetical protein
MILRLRRALTAAIFALPAFCAQTPLTCKLVTTIDPATLARIRPEGVTELLPDIRIQCSGGTPAPAGQPIDRTDITLRLNTEITNLPLPNGATDALLLIDEPGASGSAVTKIDPCTDAQHGCAATGTGGNPSPYQSAANTYFGSSRDTIAITWYGVPADRADRSLLECPQEGERRGFSPAERQPGTLTNLRFLIANASA